MNFGMTTLNQSRQSKTMLHRYYANHIKTEDFDEDITNYIEKWFDTYDESNSVENDKWLLTIGKNKKVIGLFKDELGRKIMKEFVAPEQKHMHTCWMIIVNIKKLKEQKCVY